MTKFAYAAIDAQGLLVEGVTKAGTIGAARSILVDQNLFPTKIEERRGLLEFELTAEKVNKKELMHFTRQLAVFVKAGISLTDALLTIGDESEDVALRRALGKVIDELRNGGLLSVAAHNHPEVFPEYYVGILQAAELTGRLDESLEALAGYLEREIDTRAKVVAALSYPMVVMVMAFGTVLVLAGYVLPQFKPLFEELGADLPLPTRMMLFFSRFFTDLWFVTAAFFVLQIAVVLFFVKTEQGKLLRDRLVLKIPIVSGIVDYAILERFCRILGAMVRAGVPLPEGLKTTTAATSNSVYKERLEVARAQMLEGKGFSQPLIDTELFPGAAKQMFKVGEETGTLDEQLHVASIYFDRELDSRIKKFTTMFEPIMIVFVGVIVGFVAIALVSAMYGVLGGIKEKA
ncbi:MAG: type IV pilus assembly protein PilC [Candidatus Azotimanducaceae bacterium]|jgi:type IV pilus assembly protein PilC|tara:strand:- start:4756 stop:5967 length:1212 start_codon:yes stop_codon:yes gene_type:complete